MGAMTDADRFRAVDRASVLELLDRCGAEGPLAAWLELGCRTGEVLVVREGGRAVGVVAVTRTSAWRRRDPDARRRGGRNVRAAVTGATVPSSPAGGRGWDRRSADLAARRRALDTDPHLGRLIGLAVDPDHRGRGCGRALLEGAAAAADRLDIRRLDARVAPHDPRAGFLVAAGWMAGVAGERVTCSLLVDLPWRRGPARRTSRSRLVRAAATVRPGRVPGVAAMAAEEAWGTARFGPGTARRAQGAADRDRGRHTYEAARFRTLRRTLALIPPALRRTAFVDLGCGRGRVLQQASRLPFSRILGVELAPSLVEDARRLLRDPRVEVVEADGSTWPLPDDVGVVHLFNPFAGTGLESVAAEVEATLLRRPRPLLLLLANPRDLRPFLHVGFEVVHADPLTAVLALDPHRRRGDSGRPTDATE